MAKFSDGDIIFCGLEGYAVLGNDGALKACPPLAQSSPLQDWFTSDSWPEPGQAYVNPTGEMLISTWFPTNGEASGYTKEYLGVALSDYEDLASDRFMGEVVNVPDGVHPYGSWDQMPGGALLFDDVRDCLWSFGALFNDWDGATTTFLQRLTLDGEVVDWYMLDNANGLLGDYPSTFSTSDLSAVLTKGCSAIIWTWSNTAWIFSIPLDGLVGCAGGTYVENPVELVIDECPRSRRQLAVHPESGHLWALQFGSDYGLWEYDLGTGSVVDQHNFGDGGYGLINGLGIDRNGVGFHLFNYGDGVRVTRFLADSVSNPDVIVNVTATSDFTDTDQDLYRLSSSQAWFTDVRLAPTPNISASLGGELTRFT